MLQQRHLKRKVIIYKHFILKNILNVEKNEEISLCKLKLISSIFQHS